MKRGEYTVVVEGGDELQGGYVRLRHRGTFTLYLANDTNQHCDAHVVIDGRPVGAWQLGAYSSTIARGEVMEATAAQPQAFTFYEPGSAEAIAATLPRDDRAGLISVTFVPESSSASATEPVTIHLRLVGQTAGQIEPPLPFLDSPPFSTSFPGALEQEKRPVARWKLVARDTAIVWAFTLVVGFVIGFYSALSGRTAEMSAIAGGNLVALVLAGGLIGCLIRRNRFPHLLLVATASWLTSSLNIAFLGVTFIQWLLMPLLVFPLLLLGGLISLALVKDVP